VQALALATRKARQTNTIANRSSTSTKTKPEPESTSSASNTPKTKTMEAASNDEWRRFGQARRRELVEKDVAQGGTSFHLNDNCRIQRYFQLSDRVSNFQLL
jgi:hypothetical protein